MSVNEIKKAVFSENEISFSVGGMDYLLYGWDQCDGYVLTLERDGELLWQSAPNRKAACLEEFASFYSELNK